jgi:hypothetical protein
MSLSADLNASISICIFLTESILADGNSTEIRCSGFSATENIMESTTMDPTNGCLYCRLFSVIDNRSYRGQYSANSGLIAMRRCTSSTN